MKERRREKASRAMGTDQDVNPGHGIFLQHRPFHVRSTSAEISFCNTEFWSFVGGNIGVLVYTLYSV